MAESDCSSSTSFVTSSSGDQHPQPHTWSTLIQKICHPNPVSGDPNPDTGISTPSDTLPIGIQPLPEMAFPKAGTLAYFMLEKSFAVAMNTPLERNLTESEIIEVIRAEDVQFSGENKTILGSDGGDLVTVDEESGGLGLKGKLILRPLQTGEATSCISDSSGTTESEERPWVLATEGPEMSPCELTKVLNSLHDGRVKQRTAGKGVWGYLGYGGSTC